MSGSGTTTGGGLRVRKSKAKNVLEVSGSKSELLALAESTTDEVLKQKILDAVNNSVVED